MHNLLLLEHVTYIKDTVK